MLNEVVGLYAVLNEEVVALHPVADVLLDCEVVHPVESDHPGHRIVDCVASDERTRDVAVHVEVDAVPADDSGLAAVEELTVGDMRNKAVFSAACEHEVRAVALLLRAGVSSDLDVPAEQSHLRSHFYLVSPVVFNSGEVQVVQTLVQAHRIPAHSRYRPSLGLVVIEIARRHNYLLAHFPVDCILNGDAVCASCSASCE